MGAERGLIQRNSLWCEERETGSKVIEISSQSCKNQLSFLPCKVCQECVSFLRLGLERLTIKFLITLNILSMIRVCFF